MKKKTDAELSELLVKRKYDGSKPPPAEQVIFFIEEKNIGAVQNFVTITGMQKSGKTTYLTAMAASALTGKMLLGMRFYLPENKRRVAWFDTEQGDFDFHRTIERVKSFCFADKLPSNFDAYNFREDEPKVILWLIEQYLETHPECGLIIIDGILDMIDSYNDETESKKLVNSLKKITKQKGILALLTLHKGKTTTNTLGHLGSMADRAAQSVLSVEKNRETNTFILKADYLRSAEDFTPIEIYFERNNQTWNTTTYTPESETKGRKQQLQPQDYDRLHHQTKMATIFSFKTEQTYKELVQNICELYAVGNNWSKGCLTYLMKEGIIYKTEIGYTNKQQARLYIQ